MVTSMNRCKSCGALIVYVPTVAGKMMPCDHQLVDYYPTKGGKQRIVTPGGKVVAAEFSGTGEPEVGYISHFATCPNAKSHRKGREK